MEKIIFLDIDGVVTNVKTGWYNMDVSIVNQLRFICRRQNIKIVMSSTWRKYFDRDFWVAIFGEDYVHQDYRTDVGGSRGDEIQRWLDAHEVEKYLILDDDSDMLESQQENFIQTDAMDGMLFSHILRMRDHFDETGWPTIEELSWRCKEMTHEGTMLSKAEARANRKRENEEQS